MAVRRPVFTENFSNNLEAIQSFLGPEGDRAFHRLVDRLFDEIVPTLCRFPLSGRSFLSRTIRSTEAQILAEKLQGQLEKGDDLREFIVDDYLILYLLRGNQILFLSIKHHRQMSFDLKMFWQEGF